MIHLILFVAFVGIICWLIVTLIPMDQKFKQIIVVIGVAAALLYVLAAFGLLDAIDRPLPRLR